jgi:hypothetical protein
MVIDTSFDFRKDTRDYPKKDPDGHSPTLRRYHNLLKSKALPSGARFDLDDTRPRHEAYLYHRSDVGKEFFLASDSAIPTFTRWGFAKTHPELCAERENEDFSGYVNFFLLQDLVTDDHAAVTFFMPLNDFRTPAVPQDHATYSEYRPRSIDFIEARNRRILHASGSR